MCNTEDEYINYMAEKKIKQRLVEAVNDVEDFMEEMKDNLCEECKEYMMTVLRKRVDTHYKKKLTHK